MLIENRGKKPTVSETAFVDEEAKVIGNVIIGDHSYIASGVVIRGDLARVVLESYAAVQDGTLLYPAEHFMDGLMEHKEILIGSHVIIGKYCIIQATYVGDAVFIGSSSVLDRECQISDGTVVAAGTVVPPWMIVPPRVVVGGQPAREYRRLSPGDVEKQRENAETYSKFVEKVLKR